MQSKWFTYNEHVHTQEREATKGKGEELVCNRTRPGPGVDNSVCAEGCQRPPSLTVPAGHSHSDPPPCCETNADCLGSTVFAPIKADIAGNITKIKAVYESNPSRFRTLQQILEAEKEMYSAEWPRVGATLSLMWLKRGLRFIQVLLQSLVDGEKDENNPNLIRVNVTKAYEISLRKYHSWFVQKLFKAALYAAPYKSDFLKALSKGRDVKEEDCLDKVRQFLVNFTATIDAIYEMYTKMNAELEYKA
ncbi:hypothetical protein PHYPO_G00138180 [Pangasianodon hypophthalmus]|uniref:Glycolipid transfer protein domain-containing protein n=1 Tax=Pangasianodon hypophthalmus TaxID=310915 RepID=A0A5N5KBT2_PANHP|nr:hypothetical protein PHYPO_G00138180 [Pangasianodon hypophthalmus]